ncbi:MAG: hypothetical protein ACI4N3_02620 [Alphaproteobacteria bacterium]
MEFCKRFFVVCISCIYFLGICDEISFAARRSVSKKTSRSKSSPKKRSSSAKTMTSSLASNETENTESPAPVNVEPANTEKTNTLEVTNVADNTTEETANNNEPVEIELLIPEEQQIKNVVNDENWEDFKFCMQQQCMGGPEQPLNVECYKTLNFDNAFQSCKVMINDVSKYKNFERYFKEFLLIEEQEKACQTIFAGTWDKNENVCNIEITFTRQYKSKVKNSALKNDKVGCNDNKKIVKSISASKDLKFTCTYEAFGLNACYSDPNTAQANEIGLIVGIGTTVVGATAGVVSGFAAAANAKGDATYNEDGNITGHEDATKGQKVWGGLSAGLQAGSGMVMEGVSQIATAKVSSNDVGSPVKGICKLPDGTTYSEGSVMQLSW